MGIDSYSAPEGALEGADGALGAGLLAAGVLAA